MKRISTIILMAMFTIGAMAYDFSSNGFYYTINEDGISVSVSQGDEPYSIPAETSIPGTVSHGGKTYKVTVIGANAFEEAQIHRLILPDNVTLIESYAFSHCLFSVGIELSKNLKTIGQDAFYYAHINSVELPNKLEAIGSGAFECSDIVSIEIPSSVKELGEYAFSDCQLLNNVILSGSIKTIKDYTFAGCKALTSIVIPEGIETIGNEAFAHKWMGTGELESITFPSTLKEIGDKAFSCNRLKNVVLPDNIEKLGENAFSSCNELESIVFSKNMKEIPDDCMGDCTSLNNVTIPNGITKIGTYAFVNCSQLKSIVLPESVVELGQGIFFNSGLESIQLPSKLTYLSKNMFSLCQQLKSFTVPNSITEIEGGAFSGCSNLSSIVIPESVTYIGGNAFSETAIEEITLPSGITEISEGLFYQCRSLQKVTFNGNVTSIGRYAFGDCNALSEITIPQTLQEVDLHAFFNCVSLKRITLPPALTSLGDQAFEKCTNLEELHLNCPIPPNVPTNGLHFFGIVDAGSRCVLYVPTGSKVAYDASANFINFANIVEEDVDVIVNKCAMPTIAYENGDLIFDCDTEGVEFVSEITDDDIRRNYDAVVSLTATYNISVYATKSGYLNSDVATATLCWIDVTPEGENVVVGKAEVRANPVLIQSNGGMLSICGVAEGTAISVYDTTGRMVGSATATNGTTNISTTLGCGTIGIVKIGDKAVKVAIK